eukprot:6181724-Pleurochrysis_carterae.AAC.1
MAKAADACKRWLKRNEHECPSTLESEKASSEHVKAGSTRAMHACTDDTGVGVSARGSSPSKAEAASPRPPGTHLTRPPST